jgi:hypothetical protein
MSQLDRVQFCDACAVHSQRSASCFWLGPQGQSEMARQTALAWWSHSPDGTPSDGNE